MSWFILFSLSPLAFGLEWSFNYTLCKVVSITTQPAGLNEHAVDMALKALTERSPYELVFILCMLLLSAAHLKDRNERLVVTCAQMFSDTFFLNLVTQVYMYLLFEQIGNV